MSEDSKKDNNSNNNISVVPSKYSIITTFIFGSCNLTFISKGIDSILILLSFMQLMLGIIGWFTMSKILSVGYLSAGFFSGTTLVLLRKNRLEASMKKSVDNLQEENEELKENNEELKENIDDLEIVSHKLNDDLKMLKETIGLFGNNSDEILNNLRSIYNNLKKENEVHSKLNKNTIYLHILYIIKHYDTTQNNQLSLKVDDLNRAKKTLLNAFPNLNYPLLEKKIKEYNKITAKNIYESIKL